MCGGRPAGGGIGASTWLRSSSIAARSVCASKSARIWDTNGERSPSAYIVFGPVTKRKAILVTQNMPLELRDFSGIGWRTSQCSTILPCSSRKISTTANPSSSG